MSTWQYRVVKALDARYRYGACIMKTHETPPGIGRIAYTGDDRVLYCHRNLRDVAASIYEATGMTGPYLRDRIAVLRTVRDEMLSHEQGENLLVMPYAKMMAEPLLCICQVVWLMWEEGNHPVATNDIMEIAEECDIQASTQIMERLRQDNPDVPWGDAQHHIYDHETQIHMNHVSLYAGEDDHWRERLSREDLGWVEELDDVLPE
jgi:hypothetical protein